MLLYLIPPGNYLYLFPALFALLSFYYAYTIRGKSWAEMRAPWAGLFCTARQLLRRWSWFLLFAAGLSLYRVQIYYQVRHAAAEAASADQATAAAAEAAKIVDPALVYSKMSIAVGVFCLINLLAWCALNMVLPVLADWAKGRYATQGNADAVGLEAPVVGFKRTFLQQAGLDRIKLYFWGFALQLFAAGLGVYAAFQIQ